MIVNKFVKNENSPLSLKKFYSVDEKIGVTELTSYRHVQLEFKENAKKKINKKKTN